MKILAVASIGGHWIQLLRLKPAFDGVKVEFVSTNKNCETMVEGATFHLLPEANRWTKWRLLRLVFAAGKLVMRVRPNVVITTGAAPGLLCLIFGRMMGSKTIWVDSIANVEKLSMSAKVAKFFAHSIYTQWPELSGEGIIHNGNVIS